MTIQIKQEGRTTLLMAAELEKHITPFWFDLNAWRQQGAILGSAPGRGQSYFLRWQDPLATQPINLVWRHYRRGGLISKLSEDTYIYAGLKQTRPYKEFTLTAKLHKSGLPVPRPIAAAVHHTGPFYRADLITECLPDTQSMADRLNNPKAVPWQEVGAMIRRFHIAGLDHVDLNIRNILLNSENQPFLIDLDQCLLRPVDSRTPHYPWQQKNLQRLQRSILKEFSGAATDEGFKQLTAAYNAN